ncbi:VOC family protein [Aequorivita todarodis]|uniref:VOC family protein n=1 Tax=Aequorivita todarodis TaxID=2036821 RepID=UPI0023509A57|nr:VOC family protein [Aequorivita todarodis]MDC7999922.1 VOC family protein [Aequorivita todarodis]
MKIQYVILKVDDQDKALKFYTEKLGFVKKEDVTGGMRWLTVISKEGMEGIELVLEPNFPPSDKVQKMLFDAGFPAAVLGSDNIEEEYKRLKKKGVKFRGNPKTLPNATFVPFEDTCGNIIMLVQRIT